MPKKKTARQKQAGREERRREEHAHLVVERAADPRYIQRRHTDGTVVSWSAETPEGGEFEAALKGQLDAFRQKFGREPGPDDPIFFDPAAEQAGIDPAYFLAWREVGYLVTESNQHTFSLAEITAFEDVKRHRVYGDIDD